MINYIIAFLAGALLGSRMKNSFIIALLLAGAMNVVMLWSSFQIFQNLSWWQSLLFGWLGIIVQPVLDIMGAFWAFLYGAIAGAVGWYLGKTWLKRWL